MTDEQNTEGTDTPTEDPTDVGAADILAEIEAERAEKNEQSETKKETDVTDAEGDPVEPEDEDGEKPEEPAEEATPEDETEDDDEEAPDKAPGEEKPFDESDVVGSTEKALTEAGFGKLAEALRQQIDEIVPLADAVASVYADPERAKADIPNFIRELSLHHGLDVRDILGDELIDSLDEPVFASEQERLLHQRLKKLEQKEHEETKAKAAEAARAKADATLAAHVKEVTPGVQKALEKRYDGWKPTLEQVAEAIREYPQFRDRPTKAVEAMYTRQIVQHARRSASKTAPKPANELGGSVDVGGVAIPDDPLEFKAHHAYAMRNR